MVKNGDEWTHGGSYVARYRPEHDVKLLSGPAFVSRGFPLTSELYGYFYVCLYCSGQDSVSKLTSWRSTWCCAKSCSCLLLSSQWVTFSLLAPNAASARKCCSSQVFRPSTITLAFFGGVSCTRVDRNRAHHSVQRSECGRGSCVRVGGTRVRKLDNGVKLVARSAAS